MIINPQLSEVFHFAKLDGDRNVWSKVAPNRTTLSRYLVPPKRTTDVIEDIIRDIGHLVSTILEYAEDTLKEASEDQEKQACLMKIGGVDDAQLAGILARIEGLPSLSKGPRGSIDSDALVSVINLAAMVAEFFKLPAAKADAEIGEGAQPRPHRSRNRPHEEELSTWESNLEIDAMSAVFEKIIENTTSDPETPSTSGKVPDWQEIMGKISEEIVNLRRENLLDRIWGLTEPFWERLYNLTPATLDGLIEHLQNTVRETNKDSRRWKRYEKIVNATKFKKDAIPFWKNLALEIMGQVVIDSLMSTSRFLVIRPRLLELSDAIVYETRLRSLCLSPNVPALWKESISELVDCCDPDSELVSRDLFTYALALCEEGSADSIGRLRRLFEVGGGLQVKGGNFKWRWKDKRATDPNVVDFCVKPMAIMCLEHKDRIKTADPKAWLLLRSIVKRAIPSCFRPVPENSPTYQ